MVRMGQEVVAKRRTSDFNFSIKLWSHVLINFLLISCSSREARNVIVLNSPWGIGELPQKVQLEMRKCSIGKVAR